MKLFLILFFSIYVSNFSLLASTTRINLPYEVDKKTIYYSEFDQLKNKKINFTCHIYHPFQTKKNNKFIQKSFFNFFSTSSCLKKIPILIFVPALGESTISYNKLCSLLASKGYCVIGFDLSEFTKVNISEQNYYNIENDFPDNIKALLPNINKAQEKITKTIVHLLSKLKDTKNFKALIGIKTGAPIANQVSHLKNISLISVLDPTGIIILAEGTIKRSILFFNDSLSDNNNYYNNWIQAINNQEGLIQIGEKPFYKEWVVQNHLSFSTDLRDEAFINNLENEKALNNFLNQTNEWLQRH